MKSKLRIGLGFDVHRFAKKFSKPLILGGVKLPVNLSLEAVSDADVVLHAASDAICAAANLGDIGDYFPPEKNTSFGINSRLIARYVLKKAKIEIINMDITVVAQRPKLAAYKPAMTKALKDIFGTANINVKIKSKEGLDILGGINSIACIVILLAKKR